MCVFRLIYSLAFSISVVCVVHLCVTMPALVFQYITGAVCYVEVCVCVFLLCVLGVERYTRVPPVLCHVTQH